MRASACPPLPWPTPCLVAAQGLKPGALVPSCLVAEGEGVVSWDLPLLKGYEAFFSQLQPYNYD